PFPYTTLFRSVEVPVEKRAGERVGVAARGVVGEHEDGPAAQGLARGVAAQHRGTGQAEALGDRRGEAGVHGLDVTVAHADSRSAATPSPPAAHTEMSARAGRPVSALRSARSFAVVATIRPPVAAKGWPAASEEPVTL